MSSAEFLPNIQNVKIEQNTKPYPYSNNLNKHERKAEFNKYTIFYIYLLHVDSNNPSVGN